MLPRQAHGQLEVEAQARTMTVSLCQGKRQFLRPCRGGLVSRRLSLSGSTKTRDAAKDGISNGFHQNVWAIMFETEAALSGQPAHAEALSRNQT